MPTDLCVEDLRYILDYYRLSADKRLLFGGGTVYGGTDPADIEAKLRRNMEKVFPQLTGIKIDYAWSGNCALSFTRVPQMGRLSQNTYIAHGYSGHGICGSHLFGRTLSEAINGDLTRFDVFAKLRSYPFLVSRHCGTVLSRWILVVRPARPVRRMIIQQSQKRRAGRRLSCPGKIACLGTTAVARFSEIRKSRRIASRAALIE